MSSAKGTHKKATPKKGSPAATPEKKPATKRQGTMEGTAKEGKRFLAAQAKGTSTMKLRKGSKEVDRDVQHILSEVKAKRAQKRRLTELERTALEGAKFATRSAKKART